MVGIESNRKGSRTQMGEILTDGSRGKPEDVRQLVPAEAVAGLHSRLILGGRLQPADHVGHLLREHLARDRRQDDVIPFSDPVVHHVIQRHVLLKEPELLAGGSCRGDLRKLTLLPYFLENCCRKDESCIPFSGTLLK